MRPRARERESVRARERERERKSLPQRLLVKCLVKGAACKMIRIKAREERVVVRKKGVCAVTGRERQCAGVAVNLPRAVLKQRRTDRVARPSPLRWPPKGSLKFTCPENAHKLSPPRKLIFAPRCEIHCSTTSVLIACFARNCFRRMELSGGASLYLSRLWACRTPPCTLPDKRHHHHHQYQCPPMPRTPLLQAGAAPKALATPRTARWRPPPRSRPPSGRGRGRGSAAVAAPPLLPPRRRWRCSPHPPVRPKIVGPQQLSFGPK